MLRLVLPLLLLAGCPFPGGSTPLGEGQCRSEQDCTGGELCFNEDEPRCGDCEPSQRACETDEVCGEGNVCREFTPECSCGDGPSTECVAACVGDETCADGERCDAGHCVTWACADGYTCPTHFACTGAEGTGTAGTGCERVACASDGDCGEGWCVEGACFAEPGICSYEVP